MLCFPPPPPLPWLCKGQTYLLWAPKHCAPASLWNPSLQRGTKRKSSGPSSERRDLEVQSPAGVRTRRRPPTQAPARHSPVRSLRRGGVQGAGSSGALHASGPTLTSLGRCRQRQLGNEPRPRALSRRRGGAAGSAHKTHKRRGTPPSLRLRGTGGGQRRGESQRCNRRDCRYHYRPSRRASRPNVVIRRVAASLGT